MHNFIVSVAGSAASLRWKAVKYTWSGFIERLEKCVVTSETVKEYDRLDKPSKSSLKDVGGFMAGKLNGVRRLKGKVLERSMITLDVDYADDNFSNEFKMWYPDIAAVIYGTRSDRPDSRRYRLIIPLAKSVDDMTKYEAAARKIAEVIGMDLFDPTTFQSERMMFWRSASSDQQQYFENIEGEFLNIDDVLADYGNDDYRDVRNWAFHSETEKDTRSIINKAMAQNPTEKSGVVGAFCRAYTIPEAIAKFIPDVYEECGNDRYTFCLGTSAAGMVVYDNLYCFSHHSTDPICDGHAYNAYDLIRVHKFGHLGKDDSEKEMSRLITADDLCRRELVAEPDLSDFDVVPEESKAEAEDTAELDWDLDKKGEKSCTINNFINAFKSDPLLNNLLAFDEFREAIVYTRTPFFNKGIKKGDTVDDTAIDIITERIEKRHGLYHDKKLNAAIEVLCNENAFHPIKDYLCTINWDGVPRIDTFLQKYMGADDNIYITEAFRKMLVAAVTRIFEPGTKFDTALIMYSGQGAGKSTLIQHLAKGWFNDSLTDMNGQKAYEAIEHAWIVELAELSALRRSEVEAVKNFISKREDTYRAAYARRTKTHRRQCVFFGSTNDPEFLKDTTGNRRFFPVEVRRNPNTHLLFEKEFDEVIDQLWAEAYNLFIFGESLILSDEAEEIANEGREDFTEVSPIVGIIENYVDRLFPVDYADRYLDQRLDFLRGDLEEEGTVPKNTLSGFEVWCEALGRRREDYTATKGREIANALMQLKGWKRSGRQVVDKIYGRQVIYVRIEPKLE